MLRLLQILGWDIFNADEVMPEYPVGISGGRVDYSLRINGSNKIFIEVKKVGEQLELHKGKLLHRYFKEGIILAILTNGLTWQFYMPKQEKGKTQEEFLSIRIGIFEEKSSDILSKFIGLLYKENIATNKIYETVEVISTPCHIADKKVQCLIKLVEKKPLPYDEIIRLLKPLSETRIDIWLKKSVEKKDENNRLFYFCDLPKEKIKVNAKKVLIEKLKERWNEWSNLAYYNHIHSSIAVPNRIYARTIDANNVENKFKKLFPHFGHGTSFSPSMHCEIFKNKLHVTLDLKRKKTVKDYIGNIFSLNDLTEKTVKSEFDQLQIEEPVYIEFKRGTPSLTYYGLFTEKTFELVFRNALFFYKNFKELEKELLEWLSHMEEKVEPSGMPPESTLFPDESERLAYIKKRLKTRLRRYFEDGQRNSTGKFSQTKDTLLNGMFSDEESDIVVEALHELVNEGFLKYQEGYYYLKGYATKF